MRLLFMGTGTFAEPTLALLLATPRHSVVGLVTNPDRPAGRGKTLELQRGIKTLAQQHQLEIYQPESVNTPEAVQRLGAFQADLFVVAAYGQILKPEVLAVPPRGAINVHASLLPKYRGAAPIAWAIWHGETETGVTIIRLTPSLDAGDMLEVVKTPIGPRETTGALEARLAELGAQAALAVIDRLEQGEVAGRPQDPAAVTRAPKLTKDHGRLDWSRPADLVARQAYAMQPWPTAYADLPRPSGPPLRLLIREAAAMPGQTDQPPGTVVAIGKDHMHVACGAGSLLALLAVQPEGKKVLTAGEFLRGYRVDVGARFG